jgi:hypothetical protein
MNLKIFFLRICVKLLKYQKKIFNDTTKLDENNAIMTIISSLKNRDFTLYRSVTGKIYLKNDIKNILIIVENKMATFINPNGGVYEIKIEAGYLIISEEYIKEIERRIRIIELKKKELIKFDIKHLNDK